MTFWSKQEPEPTPNQAKRSSAQERSAARDRMTRAIIASASLIVIIVFGVRWVDEYFELHRDVSEMDTLRVQFEDANLRKEKLDKVAADLSTKLETALERSIEPPDVESVREQMVAIVRTAGAALRRLEIGEDESRVWASKNDSPKEGSMPLYGVPSGFLLHEHPLLLQVDGSMESVNRVLQLVHQKKWLSLTKGMRIAPTSVSEAPVTMELNLTMFGLQVAPLEEDDMEFEDPEFDEMRIEDDLAKRLDATVVR